MGEIKFREPFERLTPINECRVLQVIEVKSVVGEGDGEGTPIREIVEYYSFEGELLARHDPLITGKLETGVWSVEPQNTYGLAAASPSIKPTSSRKGTKK